MISIQIKRYPKDQLLGILQNEGEIGYSTDTNELVLFVSGRHVSLPLDGFEMIDAKYQEIFQKIKEEITNLGDAINAQKFILDQDTFQNTQKVEELQIRLQDSIVTLANALQELPELKTYLLEIEQRISSEKSSTEEKLENLKEKIEAKASYKKVDKEVIRLENLVEEWKKNTISKREFEDNIAPEFANVTHRHKIKDVAGLAEAIAAGGSGSAELPDSKGVIYVSKAGNDANSGLTVAEPKLTITEALSVAVTGATNGTGAIPSASNIILVEILDAGIYSEEIIIPSFVYVDGENATITTDDGITLFLADNAIARFFKVENTNAAGDVLSATAIVKASGSTISKVYANEVYAGVGGVGILNSGTGSQLFARVEKLVIGATSYGIYSGGTGGGHIHAYIGDIYINGDNSIAVWATSDATFNGTIVGHIEHILSIGGSSGRTAIFVNGSDLVPRVDLSIDEIGVNIDTAISVQYGVATLDIGRVVGDISVGDDGEGYINITQHVSGTITSTGILTGKIEQVIYGDGTEIESDVKIKTYEQTSEPTLSRDGSFGFWKDTDDSDKIYLVYRRGTGDQVKTPIPVTATASPAGSDTHVQFNDGGATGGDAGFVYQKTGVLVGINNASPTSHLDIIADAGTVGFQLKQGASSTVNLVNIKNSDDQSLLYIDKTGTVFTYLQYDASVDAPSANYSPATLNSTLQLINDGNYGNGTAAVNISIDIRVGSNRTTYGLIAGAAYRGAGSGHNYVAGGSFSTYIESTSEEVVTTAVGGRFEVYNSTSRAAYADNLVAGDFYIDIGCNRAVTATSAKLLNIRSVNASNANMTVTDVYGLYVEDQVTGTNNYSIYTNAGNVIINAGYDASSDFSVRSDSYDAILVDASANATYLMVSDSGKLSFWGASPVVQSTGWSVSNESTDKSFDASATTLSEVANVLGTLIEDLKTYGILGA